MNQKVPQMNELSDIFGPKFCRQLPYAIPVTSPLNGRVICRAVRGEADTSTDAVCMSVKFIITPRKPLIACHVYIRPDTL